MQVYTLQAHRSFEVLGNQVEALRRFLSPDKIHVVQGPYGLHGDTTRRLTAGSAVRLGVEIVEAPRLPIGGAYAKQATLYAWLLNAAIPQNQWAIVLHGDCFPTKRLTWPDLLEGHAAAGRAHLDAGKPHVHYTWLAVTGRRPIFTPPYWSGDFRLWTARRERQYELCEPGFWHADRVNLWHRTPAEDKLAEIRRRFPSAAPAETERP